MLLPRFRDGFEVPRVEVPDGDLLERGRLHQLTFVNASSSEQQPVLNLDMFVYAGQGIKLDRSAHKENGVLTIKMYVPGFPLPDLEQFVKLAALL